MTKGVGTLLWMAPEIFRGDMHYGAAADVYSFGVVMWEMLARDTPWVEDLKDCRGATFVCFSYLTFADVRDHHALTGQAEFFEALNTQLQTGRRPTLPVGRDTADEEYHTLMLRCWAGDAADRPTFHKVVPALAACLRSACRGDAVGPM